MNAPRIDRKPFVLLVLLAVLLALACNLPGRSARVLPRLSGTGATPGARLTLVVIHRDTPSLFARHEGLVAPDGRFDFEPVLLAVVGKELSRHYRIYLHLAAGAADRVIFRAELARSDDDPPIRLDCELARPLALGEPCRVQDPLTHPWLLAEGRRHFDRLCSECHGRTARGGPVPRSLAGAGPARHAPDLTRLAARAGGRFDPDGVAARIEGRSLAPGHARGVMPIWGERLAVEFERHAEGDELIGATIDPLVAYLESLQQAD